tara:strand:- start:2927 stop:3100 length:174 start_codon:yes stop_codon:yes gene_type:complete
MNERETTTNDDERRRVETRRDDSSRARDVDDDDGTDRSIAVSTRATEWRVGAIDVIH